MWNNWRILKCVLSFSKIILGTKMEHKSHRIRIANIPEGKMMYSLTDRGKGIIICFCILAVLALIHKEYVLLGINLLATLYFTLRNAKILIRGYDSFLVVTDRDNVQYGDILYNSEINYWEYRIKSNSNQVMFYLSDGEKYLLDHDVVISLHDYLSKTMPDKEIKNRRERIEKGV